MKIAIQGHPTRGKEVVKIIESLGGENRYDQSGNNEKFVYYINNIGFIYSVPQSMCSSERRIYTLEEFEKEFPFKVGDIVQTTPYGEPAEVTKIYLNPACGISYKVRYKSGVELQHCPENLKFYKEMQKERNITLTLDKAKEWYNKGGELKEIALQAFTEEELTKIDLPKTWEEFLKVFPYSDAAKKAVKIITDLPLRFSYQYEALIKLNYLRDYYAESYKGNHINDYYIYKSSTGFYNTGIDIVHHTLSFPSKHLADEFLKNFKDLINKASYLIA